MHADALWMHTAGRRCPHLNTRKGRPVRCAYSTSATSSAPLKAMATSLPKVASACVRGWFVWVWETTWLKRVEGRTPSQHMHGQWRLGACGPGGGERNCVPARVLACGCTSSYRQLLGGRMHVSHQQHAGRPALGWAHSVRVHACTCAFACMNAPRSSGRHTGCTQALTQSHHAHTHARLPTHASAHQHPRCPLSPAATAGPSPAPASPSAVGGRRRWRPQRGRRQRQQRQGRRAAVACGGGRAQPGGGGLHAHGEAARRRRLLRGAAPSLPSAAARPVEVGGWVGGCVRA